MKKYVAMEARHSETEWKYYFKIYRVIKNELKYIWFWFIHYGLTKWPENEVMQTLIELKEIPKQKKEYYEELENRKFEIRYFTFNR